MAGSLDAQAAAHDRQFAALQARFIAGLHARLREVLEAPGAPQACEALHRLIGAAGIFGFTAIGQAARLAESAVASADPEAMRSAYASLAATVSQVIEQYASGRRDPSEVDTVL